LSIKSLYGPISEIEGITEVAQPLRRVVSVANTDQFIAVLAFQLLGAVVARAQI